MFWEHCKPRVLTGYQESSLHLWMWLKTPNTYFALRDNKFTRKCIHMDACPSLYRDDFAGQDNIFTAWIKTIFQFGYQSNFHFFFLWLLLPGECFICSTRTAKLLYAYTQQTWGVCLSCTPLGQVWKPLPQSCMRPTNTGHPLPVQRLSLAGPD